MKNYLIKIGSLLSSARSLLQDFFLGEYNGEVFQNYWPFRIADGTWGTCTTDSNSRRVTEDFKLQMSTLLRILSLAN